MLTLLVCFIAGMGAGLGTGFAGMSPATLNRVTGVILAVLGVAILAVNYLK